MGISLRKYKVVIQFFFRFFTVRVLAMSPI